MVDPVHPIVVVGTEYHYPEIKPGTATYPVLSGATPGEYREEPSLIDPDDIAKQQCETVIGQIHMRWSTLHPATRGITGFVEDVKAMGDMFWRYFTHHHTDTRKSDSSPPVTQKMILLRSTEAIEHRRLEREQEQLQLETAIRVMRQKGQALHTEGRLRKTYTKQWSDEDSDVGQTSFQKMYRTSTTLRSHGHTESEQTIGSRGGEASSIQDGRTTSKGSHDPHANAILARCETESFKRAILTRCMSTQPELMSAQPSESYYGRPPRHYSGTHVEASVNPRKTNLDALETNQFLAPITRTVSTSLSRLHDLLIPPRTMGLKSHRTLRNITRRSHGICTLLFFPATINLHSGSSLPDLFQLPPDYGKLLDCREELKSEPGASQTIATPRTVEAQPRGEEKTLSSLRLLDKEGEESLKTCNPQTLYQEPNTYFKTFPSYSESSHRRKSDVVNPPVQTPFAQAPHSTAFAPFERQTSSKSTLPSRFKNLSPINLSRAQSLTERPKCSVTPENESLTLKSSASLPISAPQDPLTQQTSIDGTLVSRPETLQAFTGNLSRSVSSSSSNTSDHGSDQSTSSAALTLADGLADTEKRLLSDTESLSTTSSDSFDSNEPLQEADVYALTYGCGIPTTWQPRLLLYGGAMQESLEDRRGNASDWLSEFPLYSLVPDESHNPKLEEFLKGICHDPDDNGHHHASSKPQSPKLSSNDSSTAFVTDVRLTNSMESMPDIPAGQQKLTPRTVLNGNPFDAFQPPPTSTPRHSDTSRLVLTAEEERSHKHKQRGLHSTVADSATRQTRALQVVSSSTPVAGIHDAKDLGTGTHHPTSQQPLRPRNYIFRLNSSIFNSVETPSPAEPFAARVPAFETITEGPTARPKKKLSISSPPRANAFDPSRSSSYLNGRLGWEDILRQGKTRANALMQGPRITTNIAAPPARFGSTSVVYRGRLYVFGGAGMIHWRKPTLMNDLWVLSPLAEEEQATLGVPSSLYGANDSRVAGYTWQEVPLHTATRPPPCAFHLAAVHDGFMYVLVSDCTVPDSLDDPKAWITRSVFNATEATDQRLLLNAEYRRAKKMSVKPTVLRAYQKRLERSKTSINQIWRIDLDAACPQWEQFEVTISKNMPMMVSGGVALTFYNDRLFVYGTITGHSHVAIGVLDVRLRMWVTWVKLPGAPVWVTAVAIGKLWFLFGVEVWGIFNFETFEWRHCNAPPGATIRYGSNSVWLPPYTPFPPSFEISPLCKAVSGLETRELRTMFRTDLATQYFWLMLQGRRTMDHVHTILLVGGFDAKGELSNQVDQILVALPSDLAMNCFFPVWREANLFYASLFGVNTMRGLLHCDRTSRHTTDARREKTNEQQNAARDEKDLIVSKLADEIQRMRAISEQRDEAQGIVIRQMEHRFFSRQRQLLQRLADREDVIRELQLKLERERLLRRQHFRSR